MRLSLIFLLLAAISIVRNNELSSGNLLRGSIPNSAPLPDTTKKTATFLWKFASSMMTPTRSAIISPGVTVSRTITNLPEGSSFYLTMQGDHCTSNDIHGANHCHYDWGDVVEGKYTVQVSQRIEQGDMLTGTFKIDRIIPYEFSCALCGSDCVLEVPVVNFNYTIPMPPCPVRSHQIVKHVEYGLRSESPTDGIKTHVGGTVDLTKENGNLLASFDIDAYLK